MKPYITIILLFIGQCLSAQYNPDTTISKRALDSLQQELAWHKDALRKNYLMRIVDEKTKITDSIYSIRKDTLIVLNHSSKGKIIRKQTFEIDSFRCKTYLNDAYYDTTGRLAYEEQWKLGCKDEESGITGFSFMKGRTRYQYDSAGKPCGMIIEFWNGGGHRVRRIDYTVDETGKKIWGKRYLLSEYAFWD